MSLELRRFVRLFNVNPYVKALSVLLDVGVNVVYMQRLVKMVLNNFIVIQMPVVLRTIYHLIQMLIMTFLLCQQLLEIQQI